MAPDKQQIQTIFDNMSRGDEDACFAHVDPNVEWTIQSQSIMGGTYRSLAEFRSKTFARLGLIMDPSTPIKLHVISIIGGGKDEEWATVEMVNEGRARNGARYDQTYAWCTRWEEREGEWKITQVRAYLDTALVNDVVQANEKQDIE